MWGHRAEGGVQPDSSGTVCGARGGSRRLRRPCPRRPRPPLGPWPAFSAPSAPFPEGLAAGPALCPLLPPGPVRRAPEPRRKPFGCIVTVSRGPPTRSLRLPAPTRGRAPHTCRAGHRPGA